MTLRSFIQTKVGEQLGGRIYVETKVKGKKLQVTVVSGVDTIYIENKLAYEISPHCKKEKGEGLHQRRQHREPINP